jgi:ribosomal protein S27AE
MNRWHLISIISITLTVLMIFLWFIIPGFPLLIFLFLPPLFLWGLQDKEKDLPAQEYSAERGSRFCPQCGKQLLEPLETFCPRCGTRIRPDKS